MASFSPSEKCYATGIYPEQERAMDKQFTASEVHERERFEEWYTTHAYNYSRDPIGSRDCSLQWESWKAALVAHHAPSDAERLAEALRRTCRKMKTFSRTGALDGAVAVWVDEIESVLAAHSAQAQSASGGAMSPDAETLIGQHVSCIRAEALAIQKGVNPLNCAERIVGRCDKLAEKIRESAQPPAASVPDEMVERIRSAFIRADDVSTGITDAILTALLAAQENPNV